MLKRDITSDASPLEGALVEGRKVVVVVGIDRYHAWPTLNNAVSDAKGALNVFLRLGFEQIIAPLIDEMATADAIRRLVTDELATLGGDDSLVLFFAGHGHTRTRTLQSGIVQTGYIIPVDGDNPEGHASTWLRLDAWLSDVARLPARHILVILDACHSGIALGSLIKWRGEESTWRRDSLDELRRRQSRRVITSALGDQRAMDGGPLDGHSLFTGCLIEGLTGGLTRNGQREATGSEIGAYVQQRVTSYPGSRQTPDFGTLELDDRGELVLPIVTTSGPSPPIPHPPTDTTHQGSMEALANALQDAIASRQRARAVVIGAAGAAVLGTMVAFALTRGSGGRPTPPLQLGSPETIARTDDQQLAVTMLHDGRYLRIEHSGVTVVSSDGSKSRALATPPGLTPTQARAASMNGWAEVYATGARCSWWLVPIDGGAWRLVFEDPSCMSAIDVSPDGTKLAISQDGTLGVRNLATGVERTLLRKAFGVGSHGGLVPTWSPDGKRIVVDGEIAIVDVASGKDIHHGSVGSAACWLDADRLVYVAHSWLSSEIRLLDLRTGTDQVVLEMEGAVGDLSAWSGGLLVQRDELHSRAYVAAATAATPTTVEELTQLDTGSAIDFLPTGWTPDGAVITLAIVAGQRGLVRTMPGQRGTPLVLHRTHNILHRGSTQSQIIYSLNDSDDCELRIFDLATGKDQFWRTSRCAQQPYITCARLPSRCLVVDEEGSRWFDPSAMRFDGPAPHFELGENLSPDATASVRVRGAAVVIRDLASGAETAIEAPAVDGPLDVGWGGDANTLVDIATSPGHQRMLVWTRNGGWRTIIDEPHRLLNGYVASPDGSRIAIVALLTASTWSYLPFTSLLGR